MSTVAITDDEALLRAVLANPADEAPRLIYADWLDERGDPRGEYLRLDLELTRRVSRGPTFLDDLARAKALRIRLAREWVVAISRGPSDLVRSMDVFFRELDGLKRKEQRFEDPSWDTVEQGLLRLDRNRAFYARLRFSWSRYGDYVIAMGGPTEFSLQARLRQLLSRFENKAGRPDTWYELGVGATPESEVCFDRSTVVRVMKWAYYYQDFASDVSWTGNPLEARGFQ